MRELDNSVTLRRALAPDSDSVIYQDRVVHVASYASRFLFTGEQLNQPVERLSGGERARVLIARLMLQPADVLILDEPTNDLDIPPSKSSKNPSSNFPARSSSSPTTAIYSTASPMRCSVSTVSATPPSSPTTCNGKPGAISKPRQAASEAGPQPKSRQTPAALSAARKKLSYMEQREYDTIEARIEEADARLRAAQQRTKLPRSSPIPQPSPRLSPTSNRRPPITMHVRALGRINRKNRRLMPGCDRDVTGSESENQSPLRALENRFVT